MGEILKQRRTGRVLVLEMNNPPVNALGHALRSALWTAIEAADTDETVGAVVLAAAGRTFPAGADITEFNAPPRDPWLPALCNRIEACTKPVVAALHGTTLGGGLELALAAHFRLAAPGTKLGLPEVTLGILPGAGGTQRTPRLCGIAPALDMILSGKPISAQKAEAINLIDGIAQGDVTEAAEALARRLIAAGGAPRPTCAQTEALADRASGEAALQAARDALKHDPRLAPHRIVDAVGACLSDDFDAGLAVERAAFTDLVKSGQSRALRHVFFAERAAAKPASLNDVAPRAIESVGVIGGGTMGAGICVALLGAGFDVTLVERDGPSLRAGRDRIERLLGAMERRGRLDAAAHHACLARLKGADVLDPLAHSDLAIEAVPEDMTLKSDLMTRLGTLMPLGSIIATNTSYLDLDALALATGRPQDVVGLHFFSPAHVMRLLEVVVGGHTAPDVAAAGFALAKRLGKQPVRAGVGEGFIGNRILSAYRDAADHLLEDGASIAQIDQAMRRFGFPLGPYQVLDLAGLDISWARRKRLAPTRDPRARYVPLGDWLCEAGRLGQKTGAGYYMYPEGSREGVIDETLEDMVVRLRSNAAITPRQVSDEDIVERCLQAMVLQGARLLQQGVADRAADIDVVMVHGYGFPRWEGGPMQWAQERGLSDVRAGIAKLAETEDGLFWKGCDRLDQAADAGTWD